VYTGRTNRRGQVFISELYYRLIIGEKRESFQNKEEISLSTPKKEKRGKIQEKARRGKWVVLISRMQEAISGSAA